MLGLVFEWGLLEKPGLRVYVLPGENERDRVLSAEEESRYLKAIAALGENVRAAAYMDLPTLAYCRAQRFFKYEAVHSSPGGHNALCTGTCARSGG